MSFSESLQNLQQQYNDLDQERSRLVQQQSSLASERDQCRTRVQGLETNVSELQNKITTLQDNFGPEREKLTQQVQECKYDRDTYQQQITALNDQLSNIMSSFRSSNGNAVDVAMPPRVAENMAYNGNADDVSMMPPSRAENAAAYNPSNSMSNACAAAYSRFGGDQTLASTSIFKGLPDLTVDAADQCRIKQRGGGGDMCVIYGKDRAVRMGKCDGTDGDVVHFGLGSFAVGANQPSPDIRFNNTYGTSLHEQDVASLDTLESERTLIPTLAVKPEGNEVQFVHVYQERMFGQPPSF